MTHRTTERRRANELAQSVADSVEAYDAQEPLMQYLGAVEVNAEISASGRITGGFILTQTGGPRVEVRPYERKVRVYTGSVEAWTAYDEDTEGAKAAADLLGQTFEGLEVRS